jgi:hypothetical protein
MSADRCPSTSPRGRLPPVPVGTGRGDHQEVADVPGSLALVESSRITFDLALRISMSGAKSSFWASCPLTVITYPAKKHIARPSSHGADRRHVNNKLICGS